MRRTFTAIVLCIPTLAFGGNDDIDSYSALGLGKRGGMAILGERSPENIRGEYHPGKFCDELRRRVNGDFLLENDCRAFEYQAYERLILMKAPNAVWQRCDRSAKKIGRNLTFLEACMRKEIAKTSNPGN